MKLSLVVFDMSGTTVDDVVDGLPLVLKCYDDAFREHGIAIPFNVLNDQRGRDKRAVINEFGGSKAPAIYDSFVDSLLKYVVRIREIEGVGKVFSELHSNNVLVAAGSGFPSDVSKAIVDKLGWEKDGLLDYWTCSEAVGKSRPDPIMIHSIMKHLNVKDPLSVIKVDDTVVGIEEGIRAGVITLGVLTGTQSREKLQKSNPVHILDSVRDLLPYLRLNCYL